MAHIGTEYEGRMKARAMVLKGLATTLLGWVARAIEDALQATSDNREPALMVRFRALLQQHFSEQWKVADYAGTGDIDHSLKPRRAGNHRAIGFTTHRSPVLA